jgi:hypothetical protein
MFEMLAAREIRHDTAVGAVKRDLAVEPLTAHPARWIEERKRRLVAGTLDAEDHGAAEATADGRAGDIASTPRSMSVAASS